MKIQITLRCPIEIQVKAMEQYCASKNLELVKIFKDEGISGSLENRPDEFT